MMLRQQFNLKSYIYFAFFFLKGLKIKETEFGWALVDKKRWLLITELPKHPSLNIRFDRLVEFKNPNKAGMFIIKKMDPPVCVLFT